MASRDAKSFARTKKDEILKWTANSVGMLALCALAAAMLTGCGDDKGGKAAAPAGAPGGMFLV